MKSKPSPESRRNHRRTLPTLPLLGSALGCWLSMAGPSFAQEARAAGEAASERPRATMEVDREAKQLYDQAIELLDYKQYDRAVAMLETVVRDNQGTLIAYKAHMAMGKHHLDQNKEKDALDHFLLLTRLLAPVPGEQQAPECGRRREHRMDPAV